MSANPTRVDWNAVPIPSEPASPLQEGNRVLESIARQEALRALLAFSDLHEQIRNRRAAIGSSTDRDLFETERFILDEVLQLICDRAQSITGADGILIALPEESNTERSELFCRASAGRLAVDRGTRLISESEFLRDGLESGHILRCDDCDIDTRVELDFARAIGTRSTVLVPLRGSREQIGVLQAFSITPWAFSDQDIRSFDLFAELVLTALKPEDQDRRIHWLAKIADEVLRPKPPVFAAAEAAAVPIETPVQAISEIEPSGTVLAPSPTDSSSFASGLTAAQVEEPATAPVAAALPVPEQPTWAEPIFITTSTIEPLESILDSTVDHTTKAAAESAIDAGVAPITDVLDFEIGDDFFEINPELAQPTRSPSAKILPFLTRVSVPRSARPGLSVVLGLVAVAALFSAGAWWGMRVHRTAATRVATAGSSAPQSVTAPPAPPTNTFTPTIAGTAAVADSAPDNLMNPATASGETPLVAVPANKLAALARITGVRHWSSSMGSTVVIDMEDNVPYEVHRLMSPERIYFDLHDTVLPADLDGKTMDVGDASLTRVRVAQPVAGITRIVLDTKDGSNFSVSMESSPYRLVVELHGSDKNLASSRTLANRNAGSANSAPAAKAPPVGALPIKISNSPVPVSTGRFRIVLDAGHGGWDLGTVGRQGLLEKDLVLDVTQRLGKLLQTRLGSDVVFTRTGDSYLPLDQRADLANQAQADLFVSVHANYSSSAAARGVETYYTNLFSAPGSKEVEKHDDGTFAKLTPVSLSAGGLHEKIQESQRLAASVQRSLYATLAAASPDIRNRGIKDSAFAVLTGTTMPAILTEISFVSSPADEHNLQSATYRQQIAEALYQGIARYQQSSPRSKLAQLQTSARR
jgi:N-acetylmuramoyl-L-alanine amidase